MSEKLSIRQAEPSDLENVRRFISEVYGPIGKYKAHERFTWLIERNPFRTGSRPPIWLALQGDEIIGQTCGMRAEVRIDSKISPATWGVDAIVRPAFRGFGIGHLLYQVRLESTDLNLSIWTSPASEHVNRKIGARMIGSLASYEAPVTRLSSSIVQAPVPGTIEEIRSFGSEVDEFWEGLESDYPVAIHRSSRYLNWKYFEQPGPKARAFLLLRSARVQGLLILRPSMPPERNVGLIGEVLVPRSSSEDYRALLGFGCRLFAEAGFDGIVTGTNVPEFESELTRTGFQEVRRAPFLAYSHGQEEPLARLKDRFYLCRSDSDWDQFPAGLLK
jgi:hypothetical protein